MIPPPKQTGTALPFPAVPVRLSVVIPVFNDAEALPELHRRLSAVLPGLAARHEIIFVDDGSRDRSVEVLLDLQRQDPSVQVVELTRNFGQPNAIAAGLDRAAGDLVVVMDSDLQDRPEDLPVLLEALERDGAAMAVARWSDRHDHPLKVAASRLFHAAANRLSGLAYPSRVRTFRALRRSLLDDLAAFPEKNATVISLLTWTGRDSTVVDLVRDPRFAGKSGYTFLRLLKLSLNRIFSHSLKPLRLAAVVGLAQTLVSLALGAWLAVRGLALSQVVPGWAVLAVLTAFCFGLTFLFLGLLGEYVGRIYVEMQGRPRYIIKKVHPGESNHA
ncbi:MAG: glycosyltransferase [Candidatus Zixiibacteriota bacterium]|nr:MAG: glycosyltransferase [candidate division Zixibacteria bacterium]